MTFYITIDHAYWLLKSALFNYSVDLQALLSVLLILRVQEGFRWTYLPVYTLLVWAAGVAIDYLAEGLCLQFFGFTVFDRHANDPFAQDAFVPDYHQAASGDAFVYAAVVTAIFYPIIRFLLWKILDWNAEDGNPRLIAAAVLFCVLSSPIFVVPAPVRLWASSSAVTTALVCATIEVYGLNAVNTVWTAALRRGRIRL